MNDIITKFYWDKKIWDFFGKQICGIFEKYVSSGKLVTAIAVKTFLIHSNIKMPNFRVKTKKNRELRNVLIGMRRTYVPKSLGDPHIYNSFVAAAVVTFQAVAVAISSKLFYLILHLVCFLSFQFQNESEAAT